MKHVIETDYLSPRFRELTKNSVNEDISDFDPRSASVAKPLLDAGMYWSAITRRDRHASRSFQGKSQHYQFIFVMAGDMDVRISGKWKTAGPGDLICIPCGVCAPRKSDGQVYAIYFTFHESDQWAPLKGNTPYVRPYEYCDLIFQHMRLILDAKIGLDPIRWQVARQSARYLLFLLHHEVSLAQATSSSRDPELDKLMDAIGTNPESDWTVEAMAQQVSLSPTQFHVLFRDRFGVTPAVAVMEQRMWRAGEMLVDSDDSIEIIAEAIGYRSPSSFSRLFKRCMGTSPGQYRKQKRAERDRRFATYPELQA